MMFVVGDKVCMKHLPSEYAEEYRDLHQWVPDDGIDGVVVDVDEGCGDIQVNWKTLPIEYWCSTDWVEEAKPMIRKYIIEALAFEIRDFLLEREMWIDTTIYWNGKAIGTQDENGKYRYNDPTNLYIYDADPHQFTEYAGDILTMTFEGPLYDALNYGDADGTWKTEEELTKLFEKYGLYYEMGHSWDLTAAEV